MLHINYTALGVIHKHDRGRPHQTSVRLLDGAGLGVPLSAVGGDADVAEVEDARQDAVKVPLAVNSIEFQQTVQRDFQQSVYSLAECPVIY